ncbi:MAG: NAD(P)/FAD-dependent oxidoreductase [Desulfovibrionaceae bacterium]|nr:NAD(P)/FAD-dependent oxidoreductase [Desulfovibrionaceae bacterium]
MFSRRTFLQIMALTAGASLARWTCPALAADKKAGPGEYDAVVVGAGLGGLACAALMAGNGLRPLVLERHDVVGGYASSFERTDEAGNVFSCEVSLHATTPTAPGDRALLKDMGVLDRLEFAPHKYAWCSVFPDFSLEVEPGGLGPFEKLLLDRFPAERDGIKGLFGFWEKLAQEMNEMYAKGPGPKLLFPLRFPTLWGIRDKTLAQVVDRFVTSAQAKAVICQSWGYYGLPPSRLAAFYYLWPTWQYLTYGGYYLKGTSQALSNALADSITARGGEVRTGCEVTGIVLEQGRAAGVRTDSGETFRAAAVVLNAALPQAVDRLLPKEAFDPEYLARLKTFSPSPSSMVVWLGLDRDVTKIEARGEISLNPGYDSDGSFAGTMACDPGRTGLSMTVFDNLVQGFSPKGKSTVSLTMLSGYGPWKRFEADYDAGNKEAYYREKERLTEMLIAKAEKHLLPGLSKMIVMRESSTPLTNRRFTANTAGAIYGYNQTPDNSFMSRLPVRTPVKGLYLAGAWSDPGGGYMGVMSGGKNAFKALVEDRVRG